MLVSIGAYEICDGTLSGGVAIGNARVLIERTFDIVFAIGEAIPVPFDRLIRKTTFTFEVQLVHADAGAAEAWIMALDNALPSSGFVIITTTSGTNYYILDGRIIHHFTEQTGATTKTSYTIVGGAPSSSSG